MVGKKGGRKVMGVPEIDWSKMDLRDYLDDLPPVLRVVRFGKKLVVICAGCREEVGSVSAGGVLQFKLQLKCNSPCNCGPGVNTLPPPCSCRARRNKDFDVFVGIRTGVVECGQCHQSRGEAFSLEYDGDIIVVFESLEERKKRRAVTI